MVKIIKDTNFIDEKAFLSIIKDYNETLNIINSVILTSKKKKRGKIHNS